MDLIRYCFILMIFPLVVIGQNYQDPCEVRRAQSGPCPYGTVCRVDDVTCVKAPCPPVASCVPEPQCPSGRPAVDSNNVQYFCGRGPTRRQCPTGTYCNVHPADRFAVCCDQQATTTIRPAIRPCTFTKCTFGRQCVDVYTQCTEPGCPLEAQCVDPSPYPCSATLCVEGSRCTEETLKCVSPPCPAVAKCVSIEDPCERKNCGPGEHCVVTRPRCLAFTSCPAIGVCTSSVTTTATPFPNQSDPCFRKRCRSGTECRVKVTKCTRRSCKTRATCVRKSLIKEGPNIPDCSVGKPLLNARNKPIKCRRDWQCPSGSGFCPKANRGSASVCCPIPTVSLNTTPPSVGEKIGSCPPVGVGIGGICISECSNDDSCPGPQKCCSNGCGQTCQNPVATIVPQAPSSCTVVLCAQGTTCVERRAKCSNPTCPVVAECVSDGRVTSLPTTTERAGRCPRSTGLSLLSCRFNPRRRCRSDSDCASGRKCCKVGRCGRQCRRPLY